MCFLRPFIRELNTTQRQYTILVHFFTNLYLSNFLNIFHFWELNTTWQQYTMLVHFSKNYAGWNYDAIGIGCYQNLKNLTNNLIDPVWFKSRLNVLFDLISWVTLITGWEDGLERAARWKPSVTRTLSVCAEPTLLPNSLELEFNRCCNIHNHSREWIKKYLHGHIFWYTPYWLTLDNPIPRVPCMGPVLISFYFQSLSSLICAKPFTWHFILNSCQKSC